MRNHNKLAKNEIGPNSTMSAVTKYSSKAQALDRVGNEVTAALADDEKVYV